MKTGQPTITPPDFDEKKAGSDSKEVRYSPTLEIWQRFCRHKLALAGGVIFLLLGLAAIFAPVLSPYSIAGSKTDWLHMLQAPSWKHLLGTDDLGRDVLSRLLFAGRISLFVAIITVFLELTVGITLGAIAGFFGGWVDNVIMRIADIFFTPPLLFFLLVMAMVFHPGLTTIILTIAITSWMIPARLVRGSILSLKQMDYTEAARALGLSTPRIIIRHLLPNALGPIIVQATLDVANVILIESALSFLGYGIQPPIPSWGNMLTNAQSLMINAPWLAFWPGLMILITVLSINFLGDGLRDALDPKLKQ